MNYIRVSLDRLKNFFSVAKNLDASSPPLRIISRRKSRKTQDIEFQIHNYGRLGEPFIEAKKIISDAGLLTSFSEEDQAEIIFAAGLCEYKIISQSINPSSNITIFTISAKCDKYHWVKNFAANELIANQKLFLKLSEIEKNLVLGHGQSK